MWWACLGAAWAATVGADRPTIRVNGAPSDAVTLQRTAVLVDLYPTLASVTVTWTLAGPPGPITVVFPEEGAQPLLAPWTSLGTPTLEDGWWGVPIEIEPGGVVSVQANWTQVWSTSESDVGVPFAAVGDEVVVGFFGVDPEVQDLPEPTHRNGRQHIWTGPVYGTLRLPRLESVEPGYIDAASDPVRVLDGFMRALRSPLALTAEAWMAVVPGLRASPYEPVTWEMLAALRGYAQANGANAATLAWLASPDFMVLPPPAPTRPFARALAERSHLAEYDIRGLNRAAAPALPGKLAAAMAVIALGGLAFVRARRS